MEGLLVGFDLCDTYTQVCVYDEEKQEPVVVPLALHDSDTFGDIPTVICKCRRRDEWKIGSDAFRTALESDGIMVDKLVRLVRKSGIATLEETTYQAKELLAIFIEKTLVYVKSQYENKEIDRLVFSLRILDRRVMECILTTVKALGYSEDQIRIIGHTESYLYYLLSQKTEVYANIASMFELSEEGLNYMECRVMRGMKPQIVQITGERLEEGFDMSILETPQGMRLADNIMCSCAERLLSKKIISSVCLAGKGFEHVSQWGNKSLSILCNRRKVFYEGQMFAKGAVYLALDMTRQETAYPYLCICDGRLSSSISIAVQVSGVTKNLMLVSAGTRWYQARNQLEFLLDDTDSIDLSITPIDQKQSRLVKVELDSFPVRPNKTTRVRLTTECLSEYTLKLTVEDMGFGTMFPSAGVSIEREIPI